MTLHIIHSASALKGCIPTIANTQIIVYQIPSRPANNMETYIVCCIAYSEFDCSDELVLASNAIFVLGTIITFVLNKWEQHHFDMCGKTLDIYESSQLRYREFKCVLRHLYGQPYCNVPGIYFIQPF